MQCSPQYALWFCTVCFCPLFSSPFSHIVEVSVDKNYSEYRATWEDTSRQCIHPLLFFVGLQEQIKDVFRRRSQENVLVDQGVYFSCLVRLFIA